MILIVGYSTLNLERKRITFDVYPCGTQFQYKILNYNNNKLKLEFEMLNAGNRLVIKTKTSTKFEQYDFNASVHTA